MPSCSPPSPTKRTSRARISSLILRSLKMGVFPPWQFTRQCREIPPRRTGATSHEPLQPRLGVRSGSASAWFGMIQRHFTQGAPLRQDPAPTRRRCCRADQPPVPASSPDKGGSIPAPDRKPLASPEGSSRPPLRLRCLCTRRGPCIPAGTMSSASTGQRLPAVNSRTFRNLIRFPKEIKRIFLSECINDGRAGPASGRALIDRPDR